jgi:hypothetical protein
MATETNKNITYPNFKDLFRRQQIVTNQTIKSNILNKINLFITSVKQKHS